MHKFLRPLALMLCAATAISSLAEQREMKFGYCNDQLSARYEYLENEYQTFTFGCAILIPGSRLQMLKGQKITRMRFACSEGITNAYAWAKNDLNGTAIGKAVKVGTTVEGWNEVTFTTPIEITGDDIYIGYSGKVPTGGKIYFDGINNPNGAYLLENGTWNDMSTEGYPSLCIQAFAGIDSDIPLVDLGVEKVTFATPYTKKGDEVQANVQVGNYGETEIDAPKMFYSVNGGQATEISTSGTIATNGTGNYSFSIPTDQLSEGKQPIRIWAESNDSYKGNDSISNNILIYQTSYPHKMLCEHFTTLECVNCPIGHDALAQMFKNRDDNVWVAHHIGYDVDELTQQASYDLQSFGVNSAPLAMFDRRVLSLSNSANYPVMGINWGSSVGASVKALQPMYDECVSTPAFVSVDIKNSYNAATRELTTTVSGERSKLFPIFYDQSMLTVELVEDNVKTQAAQTGSGETVHSNVFRQALTRTTGDEIQWNGDNYSETYTVTLPDNYNDKNVRVVAFVALPTDDTSHADVLNANQLNINVTTGINNVTTGDAQVLSRSYYNLQGQRISAPTAKGAYIERVVTTKGVQTIKRLK